MERKKNILFHFNNIPLKCIGSNILGTMKTCSRLMYFELMSIYFSARAGGIIIIISISYNTKVFCVFSLESPPSGDSNEYTQYIIYNI